MRVGIAVSKSTVDPWDSTCKFTVEYWTQNQYNYADPQRLTFSDTITGTYDYTNNQSTGVKKLRKVRTYTYTYPSSSYGTSPGTKRFTVKLSGAYNGVTPSKTYTSTIPARPFSPPYTQDNFSGSYYSTDKARTTWQLDTSYRRPYTSQTLQRSINTGDGWTGWLNRITLSKSTTSYIDTVGSNAGVQYRIRSNNSVGSSGYSASSGIIYTTPKSPSPVTAARDTGTIIKINWTTRSTYTSTYSIQRSQDGGSWITIKTGATGTEWFDTDAGAGTNQYRVAAVHSGLVSSYTLSNSVTVVEPPLQPIDLAPAGSGVDFAKDILLTWQHVPGGDGTPQSLYSIQTSVNGTTWTPLVTDVASSISEYSILADTYTNGETHYFQVKTKGPSGEAYSPWSGSVIWTGWDSPTVTIETGFPPDPVTAMPVEIRWIYNQNQLSPQAFWEVQLLDNLGTLLETQNSWDSAESVFLEYPMFDGETYTVTLVVLSGEDQWSVLTEVDFTIDLLPPAQVNIEAVFNECSGTVVVDLVSDVPEPGVTEPIAYYSLERRIFGQPWLTLVDKSDVLPATILDVLPITNGDNEYRTTVWAYSESTDQSAVVIEKGTDGDPGSKGMWAFVAYGDQFNQVLRVHGDLRIEDSSERVRDTRHYMGRALPLLQLGTNVIREVSVKGSLHFDSWCDDPAETTFECEFDSPPRDWVEMGLVAGLVCYRDYTGRRLFGMLQPVSVFDEVWPGKASVSFGITEVEYFEKSVPPNVPPVGE